MMHQTILIFTILAGPPPLPPEQSGGVAEPDASDAEDGPVEDGLAEAKILFDEGSVLYEAADYAGAIEKFTGALAIVKRADGGDHVRLSLLYNIGRAHEEQFDIDKDVTHLRQALALYRQYKEFAQAKGSIDDLFDVERRIGTLERAVRTHDQIERNREDARRPKGDVPPPPPQDDRAWKRPRNVGIGLAVSGGAALAGGVVLAVLGSRYEGNARSQVAELADLGVPMDHPAWAEGDEFIAQEKRKGAALMGVGGSLAAVGAAGLGAGVYYLVKAKRAREGRVALSPSLSPGFAGVQLAGRF